MEQQTQSGGYGIGAVTRLTGLPAHTLRIWERRYGAVLARRSAGGRRLYSDQDVTRLMLLKKLSDRGERIGRIAALSDEALRARLERHGAHMVQREHGTTIPRVAVFGQLLPSRLAPGLANCELLATGTDLALFKADISGLRPNVLLLEQASLGHETDSLIKELQSLSGAERVIVVFGFARREDIARLSSDSITLVRAPADPGELSVLVCAAPIAPGVSSSNGLETRALGGPAAAEITPRRYTAAELARLRAVNGTVDCECPTHLVDLVTSLTAFEVYSAQCESRNPRDAALHASLHRTTAAARALMEEALTRAAQAEGLL